MVCLSKRNVEIINAKLAGEPLVRIGARFGLSRSRVQQICSRHFQAEKARLRAEQLRDAFKASSIDKKWSTKLLLDGLEFPWRATRALKKYFFMNNISEFSLKDIIDFVLPIEKPWMSSQAYQQHGTGMKTYKELANHLTTQDLGLQFRTEWQARVTKHKRRLVGHIPIV